jgi:transcriptional regulator with XRE-family HTH domain
LTELISRVRERRVASGLSQHELARRVAISRQALSAIESGASVPGTDVALRLAQVLGASVEALFTSPQAVEARLASGAPLGPDRRVQLYEIGGELIARPLGRRSPGELLQPADGVASPSKKKGHVCVELLSDPETPRGRLVVMGCAPALGLLAARLNDGPARVSVSWVQGGSDRALDALERGEVHVAGIHLVENAEGRADAGIAIRSAALAWGLDFVPLAAERFDLVIPRSLAKDERVERLVDALGSRAFRRELGQVGGYEAQEAGTAAPV